MNTEESNKKSVISKRVLIKFGYMILAIALVFAIYHFTNNRIDTSDYSLEEINSLEDKQRITALEKRESELSEQISRFSGETDSLDRYASYISLAEVRLDLAKYDAVIEALNNIPEDRKEHDRVYMAYARAYQGLGNSDLAKENANKAIEYDDTDIKTWLLLLDVSQDLPTDQLNNLYRRAIPETKSNLDIMISYAKFCERIGDKATAIAAWETAINHDPANESKYREEISRLNQ